MDEATAELLEKKAAIERQRWHLFTSAELKVLQRAIFKLEMHWDRDKRVNSSTVKEVKRLRNARDRILGQIEVEVLRRAQARNPDASARTARHALEVMQCGCAFTKSGAPVVVCDTHQADLEHA